MTKMAASSSATRYPTYLLNNNPSMMNGHYDDQDFMDNTLNTPDIVDMLDSFHPPLFQTCTSEKEFNTNAMMINESIDGMLNNCGQTQSNNNNSINMQQLQQQQYGLDGNVIYSQYFDTSLNNQQQLHQLSSDYCDRKHSYSSSYLDSEISLENMSSPEMAPVSPNKVCPQSEYQYQYNENSMGNSSNNAYQTLDNALPIKTEYEQVSSLVDFLNDQSTTETFVAINTTASNPQNNNNTNNINNFYQQCSPNSPAASNSSHYSMDSNNSQAKTFAILDNVQITNNIKQEPIETIIAYHQQQPLVPTVVDETIISTTATTFVPQQQQQQPNSQLIYNLQPTTSSQSSSLSPSSLSNDTTGSSNSTGYFYVQQPTTSNVPTNSNNTMRTTTNTNTSNNHNNGRKRFGIHHNPNSNTNNANNNGQKKPRISKRERQKMMEQCIEQYERENKELANQIELFEKQINFCKKYLSENVAPYIQKQQQQQQPIHQQLQSFAGLA